MKNCDDSDELLAKAKSAIEASRKLIINLKEGEKQLPEMIAIQRADLGKTQSEIRRIESPKFKF